MEHFKKIIMFLWFSLLVLPVAAQKGTGIQTGVNRESTDPEIIEVSCIIKEILIGPCENTTGRSNSGTHLIVSTDNNTEPNIHLGPTNEVRFIVQDLFIGQNIKCKAFKTDKMADKDFVAIELETDGKFYLLRNSALQPIWAGKGRL